MRSEEDIEKAYTLALQAANELEDSNPIEAAGPYILMQGLAWVLERDEGEDLYEELEEDFEELLEDTEE